MTGVQTCALPISGIVLAIRWFYCDGLVRNLRLRKQHRAEGLQQWRQALFEANKLIEAAG